MSHVLVYRRFFYCYLLITTILSLSGNFLARIDESFGKRDDGKMFLEHLSFVLNVRPNVSVTANDAIAIKKAFFIFFNKRN